MTKRIYETVEEAMAVEGTGCRATVKAGGPLWDSRESQITDEQAADLLGDGQAIHAPNAGAGTYRAILDRLGYSECELANSTSSAGDWMILAFDGASWYFLFQSNRHPLCGFSYSREDFSFDSKADAYAYLETLG